MSKKFAKLFKAVLNEIGSLFPLIKQKCGHRLSSSYAFCTSNTECPTDMLTTSDSIFYFLKPHISKSKTCFEILVKKSFRWHLET